MVDAPRVRAYGEAAVLVDLPDLAAVRALHARLVRDAPPGVVDVVPAARTVLVHVAGPASVAGTAGWLRAAVQHLDPEATTQAGPVMKIPVVYDGADLPDVAAWAGLSVESVVARHAGRTYDAAFGGFLPGFTYLTGLDPAIAAPRLATPRTRVPAGAVALAGDLTAVYPRESPGGWRLLGTTTARMFDVDRDPPALVPPGARVRFVPGRSSAVRGRDAVESPTTPAAVARGVTVLATGLRTLLQDRGRTGAAGIGVGRSGAADRGSHDLANRLVGNPPDAATLEVTLGGLALRAERDAMVALAGATCPAAVDGVPVGPNAPVRIPTGGVLRLGTPAVGLRTYVAVRGGFVVPLVLGSRSTDTLAGLGPGTVTQGDRIALGPTPAHPPPVDVAPVRHAPGAARLGERGVVTLDMLPGPHVSWFPGATWRTLGSATRTVAPDSDRVALRLDGLSIARRAGELSSEGLVRGAVQVPPDGRPVVFLADHPVTGGYPVVGVLTGMSADRAAQLRPGDDVRLRAL